MEISDVVQDSGTILCLKKICLIFTVFLLCHVHDNVERSSGEMEMANRKICLIFPAYLFILEYGNKIK